MRKRTLFIASALLVIGGMVFHRAPSAAPAAPIAREVVITKLVGQHQTITICATGNGPRYSVSNSDGKILLASATLDELREKDPFSFRQVTSAIVDASVDASQPTVWAGISANE